LAERGAWTAEYWGIPLFVAEQVVNTMSMEELAKSLVHEVGHEYGFTDSEEDESQLKVFEGLCTNR
jgi:hypothetical protein